MRIHLRGSDIGVSQNCLHGAKVSTVFNHMRRATMTQHMRTRMTAILFGLRADHLPDALTGELPCAPSKEEKRGATTVRQHGACFAYVILDGSNRGLA